MCSASQGRPDTCGQLSASRLPSARRRTDATRSPDLDLCSACMTPPMASPQASGRSSEEGRCATSHHTGSTTAATGGIGMCAMPLVPSGSWYLCFSRLVTLALGLASPVLFANVCNRTRTGLSSASQTATRSQANTLLRCLAARRHATTAVTKHQIGHACALRGLQDKHVPEQLGALTEYLPGSAETHLALARAPVTSALQHGTG